MSDQLARNKITIRNRHRYCHYCDVRPNETVDHAIPLAQGGNHSLSNLLPCCEICNGEKGSALSYKQFYRYTRRFGPVSKGWRATTNHYKIRSIYRILYNLRDNPELAQKIIETKYGDKARYLMRRVQRVLEAEIGT